MNSKTLTPEELVILKTILKMGKTDATKISEITELDRGKVEGGIATLLDKGLIRKENFIETIHIPTSRAKNSDKLPEIKIVEGLLKSSLHIKDLTSKLKIEKGDATAGIGILKKSGMININKGEISLIDEKKAKSFSQDLQKSLSELINGKVNHINKNFAKKLESRGLIQIQENQFTKVWTELNEKQVNSIKAVKEISKLTPRLIASGEWKDVSFKPYSLTTKPRKIYPGRYNPYRQFLDHLKTKLIGLGFEEMKGPLIEQEFWNFDALFAAQDHSAREDTDILLVKSPTHGNLRKEKYVSNVARTHENGWKTGSKGHGYKWDPAKAARLLLRPQGTAISARTLAVVKPPAKYFSIARCFRPDQIDSTHDVEFDQTEGIICDPKITFRDLLGMLKTFAVEVAGASEVRFRPDYYPFTCPSVELSAKHPVLGYIEFGGAGIFRPEVTRPFGIDYPVLAWGLGVGRLFMTKYHVSDIRELFSQNLDWLRDEKVSASIQVEEI